MNKKMSFSIIVTASLLLVAFSCTKDVQSNPLFIFKPAPDTNSIANVAGDLITNEELSKGIKTEIYDAEMKVYELKMNKLKAMILEKLMNKHTGKKGLSNDQFLEKFITNNISASNADIEKFAKERKIPKEQINDQMKGRIKQFLEVDLKKKAIDKWIASQTSKSKVEVYLQKPARPVFKVEVGNAATYGNANAKVTIVEFSDFQCPFCAKGADILNEIKKKYGKKVRIAFKQFPLPFHNHASKAAEASLCANEQGSDYFWKMHDGMFADQTKLDKKGLISLAKKIELNEAKFSKCFNSAQFAEQIKKDMAQGRDIGVKSTPTFFVNGQIINGAQPIEVFSEIIDTELKK